MRLLPLLLIVAAGCSEPGRLPDADADLQAVRAWLRENLDSPEWEEVRWWPTRTLEKRHAEQILGAEAAIEEVANDSTIPPDYQAGQQRPFREHLEELKERGPSKACRLKYRVRTRAGGWELRDEVFRVENGRVERLTGPPHHWGSGDNIPDFEP